MKHALYEITKNIPPPIVSHKSKTNGIAHLVRTMKKGDSALVLTKQVQAAKASALKEGIVLVWQRIGKGTSSRIWHVGFTEQEKQKTVRKYTRRHAILSAQLPRVSQTQVE